MVVLVVGWAVAGWAQAEAFRPDVAPAVETLSLLQLIKQGGITMFPLGLFSVAVVALVVVNFLALKRDKLLRPDLVPTLRVHMANRDVESALDLCRHQSGVLPAVIQAGMERVTGDSLRMEDVREAVEEAGTEQMVTYMRPVNYLSIIGATAPMLGLLGTVSGMIKAFQNIAAGGMGKPEVLAGNIGEALVTTATGLIIAIPAMIFYFYFKNDFLKNMAGMGREVGGLLNNLSTGELSPSELAEAESALPIAPPPAEPEAGAEG
jgi:biopolymer transport protein ExbB